MNTKYKRALCFVAVSIYRYRQQQQQQQMLSASVIILEYICPAAGMIMGNVMFAAPLRDAYRASAGAGDLGELNPKPWAFMLGNCFGWVTYSILIRNFFVFFANVFGFLFAVWLNLQAVQLLALRSNDLRASLIAALPKQQLSGSSKKQVVPENEIFEESAPLSRGDDDDDNNNNPRIESGEEIKDSPDNDNNNWFTQTIAQVQALHLAQRRAVPHEVLVLLIVTGWIGVASFLVFAEHVPSTTKELIVGIVVNMNLVVFYGAPLSTIWKVLSTQSSASIHIPTMLTNTANGTFWFAYGAAITDYFIMVPNGLGALLGVVQIVLCVVFPRKLPARHETKPPDDKNAASPQSSPTASVVQMEEGHHHHHNHERR